MPNWEEEPPDCCCVGPPGCICGYGPRNMNPSRDPDDDLDISGEDVHRVLSGQITIEELMVELRAKARRT